MKSMLGIVAAIALLASLTPVSRAAVFNEIGPGQADVDVPEASAVDVLLNVATAGTITDANLALEINSPYIDNLTIALSHLGTTALIYVGAADTSAAYMNAIFDDAAGAAYPTAGAVDGTFLPEQALSAFNGMQLAGLWTLTIFDHNIPGDGTDLLQWRVFGTTAEDGAQVPEPASFALLALGGAALLRRRRNAA